MLTIFGKTNCPQCEQAKMMCKSKSVEFEYKMVGEDISREELIEKCPVPVRSVPVIFDGEEFVGGVQQLAEKLRG